ncbi:uncharacterized protein [Coffea arabica]|uniref:Uncharacterized protein n=1 Tax=Coffea arabica TaxID=13443 RepID=A0ABM4VQG4_COFAR
MVAHDSWANVVNATVVYAKCKQSERRALWSELGTIASTITRPWLVCWDFNIISSVTEYVGRATQDLGAIADFNEAISSCCLTEVPFSVKETKRLLKVWNKQHFGDIFQAVKQREMEVQQRDIQYKTQQTEEARSALHQAQTQLLLSLKNEGIKRIKDGTGAWVEDEDQIVVVAVNIFKDLLSVENVDNVEVLIQHIPALMSMDQNKQLLREVTLEEIKQVVFELDGNSALGSDGFFRVFFTNYWDIVAEDIL